MHIEFGGLYLVLEHRLAHPSGEIKNTGLFGKIAPHRRCKTNRITAPVDHMTEPGLLRCLRCSCPTAKSGRPRNGFSRSVSIW